MVKYSLILFFFIITCSIVVAQNKTLTKNEKISISNLKDHITYKRKEAVAKHIIFPLERCDYFDYYINDKKDFVTSFDLIFDSIQIEKFQTSEWEYIYYPTFEYYSLHGGGYIGEFTNDGVLSLKYISLSESEKKYIQELIKHEKETLHPCVRNYLEPVCLLFAGKYRIRIDRMPDNSIRYSSWKRNSPISDIPDLIIYDGKISGNRWGEDYYFKNKEYEYHISHYFVSESPSFCVSKNGEIILFIDSDVIIKEFSMFRL